MQYRRRWRTAQSENRTHTRTHRSSGSAVRETEISFQYLGRRSNIQHMNLRKPLYNEWAFRIVQIGVRDPIEMLHLLMRTLCVLLPRRCSTGPPFYFIGLVYLLPNE